MLYFTEILVQAYLIAYTQGEDSFPQLTLAAAMTTLSHILWPLAVLLRGLVEAQTL